MMMIYKVMIMSLILMTIMKNPISKGTNLLLFNTMTTMMINKMLVNSWFSMITFLMMISGLLIIFSYMSSIASNEMFKMSFNLTSITLIMLMISDEMMQKMIMNVKLDVNLSKEMEMMSLSKMYNKKSMTISIMLVMFLLISISKTNHKGPLGSK